MLTMTLTPQQHAAEVANRTPRPLTNKQKVKLGLAGPADPVKLSKLATKRPERERVAPTKSKNTNGWTR